MKYLDIRKPRINEETDHYISISITPICYGGIPMSTNDIEEMHIHGFELSSSSQSVYVSLYLFRKRIDANRDWLERQLANGKYSEVSK